MGYSFIFRYSRLVLGIILCAFGMVMIKNSNIGFAPWQVLHDGMGDMLNITMGEASIITGFIMMVIGIILKEQIGLGTWIKLVLLGYLMDVFTFNGMIPIEDSFTKGLSTMIFGMVINSIGAYLYISAGLGYGVRDGCISGISRKINKSKSFVRNIIELSIVFVGYQLNGFLGVGTVIAAIFIGRTTKFTFKLLGFDTNEVYHTKFKDEIVFLYSTVVNRNNNLVKHEYMG